MKTLIVLLLLIPSLSWGNNCSFPISNPIDGSLLTEQEWNNTIKELKYQINNSGMSKSQIVKLLKEEVEVFINNPSNIEEMRQQSIELCNQLGPIDYYALQNCGTKLFKKAANQIGFNSTWFLKLEKEYQKLIPVCSSTVRKNNDKSNETFDEFCKNAKLEDLDKDVALLCIEKIK